MLRVVPEPRSTENDPGSSQGSGVAYDAPSEGSRDSSPDSEPQAQSESEPRSGLRVVVPVEQSGMTEVVREFHENKKEREPPTGLTTRYHPSAGNTKGLLLNRKAE